MRAGNRERMGATRSVFLQWQEAGGGGGVGGQAKGVSNL